MYIVLLSPFWLHLISRKEGNDGDDGDNDYDGLNVLVQIKGGMWGQMHQPKRDMRRLLAQFD